MTYSFPRKHTARWPRCRAAVRRRPFKWEGFPVDLAIERVEHVRPGLGIAFHSEPGLLPQPGGFEGVSAEAESRQCSRQRQVVLQAQDALLSQ